MSTYTVERTYPIADWYADPLAAVMAFRKAAAIEGAEHGHSIDDVANVTAYLEDADGQPDARTPAQARIVAVWASPTIRTP